MVAPLVLADPLACPVRPQPPSRVPDDKMDRVKRALTLFGLLVAGAGLAAAGVTLVQRLDDERQYRALLAQGEQALDAGNAYGAIEAFSGALALRPGRWSPTTGAARPTACRTRPTKRSFDLREAAPPGAGGARSR